jgi:sortase (surface protein transpeptidase)
VTATALQRFEFGLAVVVPAVAAAAATLVLFPTVSFGPSAAPDANAARLARLAELRPIVLTADGEMGLGTSPAGPMTSGTRPAVPASLAIPALQVDTDIQPVSATPTGIEVPAIGQAGWFDAGPRPGEPGRSVLIGHLDGLTLPGVFENVPSIATGSAIVVRDADGGVHEYEVVGKTQVPKSEFPASEVYGPSKTPVLVLITCGGSYEPGVGYSDNVIVYARARA